MDSVSEFFSAAPWWAAAQTDDIGERARSLEAQGELSIALDHWRLVERTAMDPAAADREISRLERKIAEAVHAHYQSGMAELRKNSRWRRPATTFWLRFAWIPLFGRP